jgi:trk system potassium uptake protein TrkH
MINIGIVVNVVGVLLVVLGSFMLTALPFALYYQMGDVLAILGAATTTIIAGLGAWFLTKNSSKKISKRDGFLIVTTGWAAISFFCTLPYSFSGVLPEISNAIFESVSGLTTTGASVINDIEAVPKGILFWRSLTQWLGGMGIIVLTVAILPLLGIGGVELFVAEAPGPTSDKIHPRIKETAKRLWLIYMGLTGILGVLLFIGGMNFYDAVNHALTTMATGGFSTKNASMAHFDSPFLQYTVILFMFIAGINYTITYYGLKGNFKKVWSSDEFRTYCFLVLGLIISATAVVFFVTDLGLERSFRDVAFQIVSLITTTGFVSADYTSWTPALTLLCFFLLSCGACAGSTSGGVKIIRYLVIVKNSFLELKRLLHPKAIIRTKVDKQLVTSRILTHILVFLMLYIITFIIGSIVMTVIMSDFEQPLLTALGSVATSLGNVGPAIGELGPVDNFAGVPASGKWVLVFLMLLGRLELFTVLILFTPYFWKHN